jgi:hypothetical protein
MADTEFSFKGLKEIEDDMKKVVEAYPVECRAALDEQGKAFRKFAAREYKKETRTARTLTKGFSVSKPKGFGMDMYVEFSAETGGNPHFHLIENGHEIILPYWTQRWAGNHKVRVKNRAGGDHRGFVPGVHAIPKIRNKYAPVFIAAAEAMIDRLLKKGDLA